MTKSVLLWIYGLSTWGAAVNFPAWAALFVRRWRTADRLGWWLDVPLLLRTGLTLFAFGVAGLAGVRLTADLLGDVPLSVPSPIAVLFIGAMAAAEPIFLRIDDIHARARGSWSRSWWVYWAGALAWTLYVIVAG